jgi:hypothetical protein
LGNAIDCRVSWMLAYGYCECIAIIALGAEGSLVLGEYSKLTQQAEDRFAALP